MKIGRYDGGCWSYVGNVIPNGHPVNLDIGCIDPGTIRHEIMHMLGWYHEQSRFDRDDYITIDYNNMNNDEDTINQFEKRTESFMDSNGRPYDYESVMHYGPYAFSNNGQPTIIPNQNGVSIGNKNEFSAEDLIQLKLKYRCTTSNTNTLENTCACRPCPIGFGVCHSDSECSGDLICGVDASCIEVTMAPTLSPLGVNETHAPTTISPTKSPTKVPTSLPTDVVTVSPFSEETGSPTTNNSDDTPVVATVVSITTFFFGMVFAFFITKNYYNKTPKTNKSIDF